MIASLIVDIGFTDIVCLNMHAVMHVIASAFFNVEICPKTKQQKTRLTVSEYQAAAGKLTEFGCFVETKLVVSLTKSNFYWPE